MGRRRKKAAGRADEPIPDPAPRKLHPVRPNRPFLLVAVILLLVWVTFLVTLALAT